MGYSRIAKNARLGDGSLRIDTHCKNASITFVSTDKEVLAFKKKLCDDENLSHADYGTQKSGYGGTKTIYNFRIRSSEKLTEVYHLPMEDLISALDEEDIYMWLIDDGSWHKNCKLFHLYCNMLDDEESELLTLRIEELFGVKPTIRKDRKKDGREFNYLYFPRQLTVIVRPKFKQFLLNNNLSSMIYKTGGLDYYDQLESLTEETILSDCFISIVRKFASARSRDKDAKINEEDDKVTVNWKFKGADRERVILKEAI